ncbi:hypothetical protein [Streptomyces spinosirectus]
MGVHLVHQDDARGDLAATRHAAAPLPLPPLPSPPLPTAVYDSLWAVNANTATTLEAKAPARQA